MRAFKAFCGRVDPLRIHYIAEFDESEEAEPLPPKSDAIMNGLRAIDGLEFQPSFLSCRRLTGGAFQTLMTGLHLNLLKLAPYYPYDKIEDFILTDGGQITLSYKGEFKSDSSRPVIFFLCGQSAHAQRSYMRDFVDKFHQSGYDVVVIGYRGIGLDSKF